MNYDEIKALELRARFNIWSCLSLHIGCQECGENDPAVVLMCRDGMVRCAHHANLVGLCWGCGDGDPHFNGDDTDDGLCHDCRSADAMRWRSHH